MFKESLVKGAKENLALLGQSGILKDAYLAGETAAALQLGHLISIGLDFFTELSFLRMQESIVLWIPALAGMTPSSCHSE